MSTKNTARKARKQMLPIMAALARGLAETFDRGVPAITDDVAEGALRTLRALAEGVETVRQRRDAREGQS